MLRQRALRSETTEELLDWVSSFFAAQDEQKMDAWTERAIAAQMRTERTTRIPRGVMRRRRNAA